MKRYAKRLGQATAKLNFDIGRALLFAWLTNQHPEHPEMSAIGCLLFIVRLQHVTGVAQSKTADIRNAVRVRFEVQIGNALAIFRPIFEDDGWLLSAHCRMQQPQKFFHVGL